MSLNLVVVWRGNMNELDHQIVEMFRQVPVEHRRAVLAMLSHAAVPHSYGGYFVDRSKPPEEQRAETLYELDGLVNAQTIGFTVELLPHLYPFLDLLRGRGSHLEALDVGSRTGAGASLMAEMFMTYHSHIPTWFDTLDIDPTFQEYQMSRWPHIRKVIVGNIFDLPNKSYDFVVCSHTIEHIRDPAPFCRKIQSISREYAFFYCPYNEKNPIQGHFNISDEFINSLNPIEKKVFKSWWWRPKGEMEDVVFFVLPGL